MPHIKWTEQAIRDGIRRFTIEFQRDPTATDFDSYPYLPSARQVQRAFGGLEALRIQLGYENSNFTKGSARSAIAANAGVRGVAAEELLETELINRFGEPYVHSQKRYIRTGKSRYDFFVYAKNYSFGIDIFATDRKEYIDKNVRHKIKRYADTSKHIQIYFVVYGDNYTTSDIEHTQHTLITGKFPNIVLCTYRDFLTVINTIHPLPLPLEFKSILS